MVSLGDIAQSETIKVAGDTFDGAIVRYVKDQYKLEIGSQTAESVKKAIGSAFPEEGKEETEHEVRGRDTISGLPRRVQISSEEIREALRPIVVEIAECIKRVIDRCGPELHSDLLDTGICLAGGGGMLRGLVKLIEMETGLPCKVAEESLYCVAKGTAVFLENIDLMGPHMDSDMGG